MSEAINLAPNETVAEWESEGLHLGERERSAGSLMWDIGDWWNRGERYGKRVDIVTAPEWTGPRHTTCWETGRVAKRWPPSNRFEGLTFKHHAIVAALSDAAALPLLQAAEDGDMSTGQLRALAKRVSRGVRERALADATRAASTRIGTSLYNVIYADPPWRFEPYSRTTGMDRAADNHYPTMDLEAICAMQIPAAEDCVLFLWATVPMLPEALAVVAAWGFVYRSHFVWLKDRIGTGYWNRNQHELLLVGTRGDIPAPAPGEQYTSVLSAPAGEHSAKPPAFAEMIEELFPSLPALEMFARAPRLGWEVWGNEAQ
jgi:N6-adenosine-specific RNA methylase IME4